MTTRDAMDSLKTGPYDQEMLREHLWDAINKYAANRGDLNARSKAAARVNELLDMMVERALRWCGRERAGRTKAVAVLQQPDGFIRHARQLK